MKKNYIIDTIEKAFRYFIPGFIFVILLKLSFPSNPAFIFENIKYIPVEFHIGIFCLGMIIYSLYRIFLSIIIEPILYKLHLTAVSNFANSKCKIKEYPLALAEFFKIRHRQEKNNSEQGCNLSGYLYYIWSMLHSSLILSVLLFIFYFFHEKSSFIDNHKCAILIFGFLIFLISFLHMLVMYKVEKGLFDKENT